jgi:hypothetical protein
MPSIEEYQKAQTEVPSGHYMHYANGRILVNWRAVKEDAGRRLGIPTYDLGHMGRSFDDYPRYIVIDTALEQKDDRRFGYLCTEYEFVRAVREGLEVFLSDIDLHYKDQSKYYKEAIIKETHRLLATLQEKLDFLEEFPQYHNIPVRIHEGSYTGLTVDFVFEES